MQIPGLGQVQQKEVYIYYDEPLLYSVSTPRGEDFLVAQVSPYDTVAVKLDSPDIVNKTVEELFYSKLILYVRYARNSLPLTKWLRAEDLPPGLLAEKHEIFVTN